MADGYIPPQEVRSAAKRGLELRKKHNRGGTAVGVARARDLSNGKAIPIETINRMISYFARHEVDKKGEGWGVDSAGYIAWLLWGGDPGRSWATRIKREHDKKDKSSVPEKPDYEAINEGGENSVPSDTELYNRIKREAKEKFDVYPSAVANAWVVREYKERGGRYRKETENDKTSKEKSMALELAHSYAQITKSEKQEDGTLKVYGKATDDSLDIDSQICDPTWLASAMPDWFESGGNIREQHSNIAAGVATEYEMKGAEHFITALVVDPVSVKKVETGVLKGFSIGIRSPRIVRDTKAANGRIIDGQIVEVSLVDRPANPNAKLMLAKAAESGELMAVEQGSIPTPADLFAKKNADAETTADEVSTETPEPTLEEVAVEVVATEEVVETSEPVETAEVVEEEAADVAELLNTAKSFIADLKKFDQAIYDKARTALADLIVVEAKEMAEGSDERESIDALLHSVKHLFDWYEGEAEEGEVSGADIEIPELEMVGDPSLVMSADGEVELECECGLKMCDKCSKSATADDEEEETEKSVQFDIDPSQVDAIMEKAVAGAKASIQEELDILKAAKVAAEQKASELEAELAQALTKAVSGGPKRVSDKIVDENAKNELLQKAAQYAQKAKATNDVVLAKGYSELADELTKKANQI